ncbi:MAG: uracil-DNA glycosylase [Puniceicoccales bacterium]|jgi:DNA polymerase|nr:uracil-DNA glycosylase [Puniceicoccales bacterium]
MSLSTDKILELLEMELFALREEGVPALPISSASVCALGNEKFPQNAAQFSGKNPSGVVEANGNVPLANVLSAHAQMEKLARITLPAGTKAEQYAWLKEVVLNCEECRKHVRPGKKIVFGIGNVDADIFFCGEAPGADEETMGEPFVGRAGQLLTKIIAAMGLERSSVYIANIMNWRPEMPTAVGNRPPTQQEMEFCMPYLLAQLEIVKPKTIVALGATAAGGLLGHDPSRRMRDVRGKWSTFNNIPLMVTFHPSYLLRNGTNASKRIVWEDMLLVMDRIGLRISEKQRAYFL